MDSFSFEDGITASTWPTIWALRIRISMSAIGSLMLIDLSLPACLDHAGDLALERKVAELIPAEAELAVHAARPTGQRAAVAQPHGRGVSRQLLNLGARFVARFVGGARVVHDFHQCGAPGLELLHGLAALLVS